MPGQRERSRASLTSVVLVLACAVIARSADADEASTQRALEWLERMIEATERLSYDGTFVYRNGEGMQSMRIIHRNGPDGERARLVSLTGIPREVIRDARSVICILPDDRSVVVTKSKSKSLSGRPTFRAREGYASNYRVSLSGRERVAGRETQVVVVVPTDEYRYGYRLSIDEESALLLKSQLNAPNGAALEEIFYTTIDTSGKIDDALLEPTISVNGFTWYRNLDEAGAGEERSPSGDWQVNWLPSGFMLSAQAKDPFASSRNLVEYLVYTDGLASVSVYIERLASARNRLEGLSSMGAANAFGRVIGDHQITAVGEVPARTVERIARQVVRK